MGLGVGVNHLKFDPDSSSLAFNKNGFTADLGFAFKSKKFNISIGATQITQSRIGSYRESINFAFASDYIFGNEDGLQLKSQVFVLGDITTAVCDLNATILWKEKLGVGFTYRSNSDFGFSINWDLFKKFRFGYTYELPYSISGQTSKGTHAGFFGLVFK